MPLTVLQNLSTHAQSRPDDIAIVEHNHETQTRQFTWVQLNQAVNHLAAQLNNDLPDNATIILASPNVAEFIVAFLAIHRADKTVLSASPDLSHDELIRLAENTSPHAIISSEKTYAHLKQHIPKHYPLNQSIQLNTKSPPPPTPAKNASLILQSSGTTGMPKLVHRSGESINLVGTNCANALQLTPNDHVLVIIPIHHSYGIEHGLLAPIIAGSTIRLYPRFTPAIARQAFTDNEATIMPGVPFMFEVLANANIQLPTNHKLRHVYSAGGPLPTSIYDAFQNAFKIDIGQFYGATEFGTVSFSDPNATTFNPQSVGQPFPDVHFTILDVENPDLEEPLETFQTGHIAVKTPTSLTRYIALDENPTIDDYFYSGDLGHLDQHNNLCITGRIKLLIDVGSLKVNPMEVESILAKHPHVAECVVIPSAISETAFRPKAIIVPSPDITPNVPDIRQFLKDRLSTHKVPRTIEVRQSLPKSPTGKILRNQIKDEA